MYSMGVATRDCHCNFVNITKVLQQMATMTANPIELKRKIHDLNNYLLGY